MFTIRGRLLWAFLGVIATLSLAAVFFLGLSFFTTQQYKTISDTMIAEYQLVANIETLIDAYNRRVQSAGADTVAEREQKRINDAQQNIRQLVGLLDDQLLDTQSMSDYLGFRAAIEKFTAHIDDSLERFEQSNIKDYFTDFDEANKQYGYVRDNGTVALFSQLRYAASIQDAVAYTYRVSVLFGVAALALLLVGCVVFVVRFSSRLAAPLASLTAAAEKIAAGDVATKIDTNFTGSSSEIQSLARSFATMVNRLLENIKNVDAANQKLEVSSHELLTQNDELARLNKLMVDRELKMMDLKKEIAQLKNERPQV